MYNAFNHDMMAVFGSTDTDVKGMDKKQTGSAATRDNRWVSHISCPMLHHYLHLYGCLY